MPGCQRSSSDLLLDLVIVDVALAYLVAVSVDFAVAVANVALSAAVADVGLSVDVAVADDVSQDLPTLS